MKSEERSKSARDLAWELVRAFRRDFVGRREPTDDDWAEAIEKELLRHLDPDDRYQDGS